MVNLAALGLSLISHDLHIHMELPTENCRCSNFHFLLSSLRTSRTVGLNVEHQSLLLTLGNSLYTLRSFLELLWSFRSYHMMFISNWNFCEFCHSCFFVLFWFFSCSYLRCKLSFGTTIPIMLKDVNKNVALES